MRRIAVVVVMATVLFGCTEEPNNTQAFNYDDYFLLPQRELTFTVDSTIYDPAPGGILSLFSTSKWHLSPLESNENESLFAIEINQGGQVSPTGLLWDWSIRNETSVNTLAGVSYVGLTSTTRPEISWNPLVYADDELILTIKGEPIAIHKGTWSANVDSLGHYTMPNGDRLPAIYVTLVASENLIELREWKEVYVEGEGLVKRTVRIMDTQNIDGNIPWEERAEAGFQLTLQRSN